MITIHFPKWIKSWIWEIEIYIMRSFITLYTVIMTIIQRSYLQKLINVIGTSDIKVITWVRRSWKSELLIAFKKYLDDTIIDSNIIDINFSDYQYKSLRNADELYKFVESKYDSLKQNFLLIDEVQMCDGFEDVINSFHNSKKYDIYLTWSNAFLSSSDLATLFTWRTFEISIFPFSFQEFLKYYKYDDLDLAFWEFIDKGWMAWSYQYETMDEKNDYIKWIYETLIRRDIINKYHIKYWELLDNITKYLMDNISNITTIRKITNELKSKWTPINHKTISSYIQYLCNAFIFYKIKRYDIHWKRYLSMQDKYYLVDHKFRYAINWNKNQDIWRVYENIVAIELLRRWYEIYVWVLHNKEIDFVAMKRDEVIYIQVSDNINDEKTFQREITPLLQIRDAYPKILIARTRQSTYQHDGVQIIDIARWLNQSEI